MNSVARSLSFAMLVLGLALGTPVQAAITVQDDGSYMQRSASTGFGTIKGSPRIPLYLSVLQKGKSPASFEDYTSGFTATFFSSVSFDGALTVQGEVRGGDFPHLYIYIHGRASVHARRDPQWPYASAGGLVSVVGKIAFTLSQPACLYAWGDIDSANLPGHSESSVSIPDYPPLRSAGSLNDLTFYRGPFEMAHELSPGTYKVVGKASEDHTLGGAEAAHSLSGHSHVELHLIVTEDLDNCSLEHFHH
jgi:hypothetical protein